VSVQLLLYLFMMTVRLWDAKTGRSLYTLEGHTEIVSSVAFSPAGDRLASASHDKKVRSWNTKTGQSLEVRKGYGRMELIGSSPDGSHLETNRGTILLSTSQSTISPISPSSFQQYIVVRDSWITVASTDVLWLPIEYRPSTISVLDQQVAIDSRSGFVLLISRVFLNLVSFYVLSLAVLSLSLIVTEPLKYIYTVVLCVYLCLLFYLN
jgi:WD40 repeat protein